MKARGRPILGAISGLVFGLMLAADLVFQKVLALDSVLITVLPVAGLALGIALALWAPLGRKRLAPAAPAAPAPTPPAEDPSET